jgi:hypothetical protein
MIGNMETVFNLRLIVNNNWATILLLISFILIVTVKTLYSQRFFIFLDLFYSNKYFKLYNKSEYISSIFNILLYIKQLIVLSFFIILILDQYNICSKNNGIVYLQIITSLFVISMAKYFIEKIIAIIFEIDKIADIFNHYKMSYRSFFTLFLFPITTVLFYNNTNKIVLITMVGVLIIYNTITYINILKFFKSNLFSNLFYFILYLCTLEIAPYYFIYYWIKNN